MIDPTNPVVVLCARGMEAEGRLEPEVARALFLEAWEQARDDYEASIAAHYVARHQSDPAEARRWNQVALDRALADGTERIGGFLPSLHLSLGHSLEQAGDLALAREQFALGAGRLDLVPEGPYRDLIGRGLAAARERTGAAA